MCELLKNTTGDSTEINAGQLPSSVLSAAQNKESQPRIATRLGETTENE